MIESKVMEKEVEQYEYPKLMIDSDGLIVLFHGAGAGTLIDNGRETFRKIGDYDEAWWSDFKPFHGSVTLTNK